MLCRVNAALREPGIPGNSDEIARRRSSTRHNPGVGIMHRAMHAEVAVVAPDGLRRLARIELHGVESLACDRLLR